MDGKDVLNYYTDKSPLKENKVNPTQIATAILSQNEIKKAIKHQNEEIFFSILQEFLKYSNKVWNMISKKGQYRRIDFDIYQSTASAYYKAISIIGEDIKEHRKFINFIYNELSKDDFDRFDSALLNIIERTERHIEHFDY